MRDKLVLRFLGFLEAMKYILEQPHSVPPVSVALDHTTLKEGGSCGYSSVKTVRSIDARVPCTLHENAWYPRQGARETLRGGLAFPLQAPSLRHREPRSVMPDSEIIAAVRNQYQALRPVLDETVRRRWAACEAMAIGWGGHHRGRGG